MDGSGGGREREWTLHHFSKSDISPKPFFKILREGLTAVPVREVLPMRRHAHKMQSMYVLNIKPKNFIYSVLQSTGNLTVPVF